MFVHACGRRENMSLKTCWNSTITVGEGEILEGVPFNLNAQNSVFMNENKRYVSCYGRGFASDEEEAPRPLWATLAKFA